MSCFALVCALFLFQANPQAQFEDLARRASSLVDQKPDESVSLYRQALALRPQWAEGWLYMGAGLYKLGRYGESKDAFLKGIQLEPKRGTAWAFLGLSEYELGEYDAALAHIFKAESMGLADNPGFVAAVRQHAALIFLKRGDFPRAVEQLRPLATIGANSPAVIEAMGLGVLGLPTEVSAEKHELVMLAGQGAWAFFAQRPDEAKAAFDQLLAKYPNEPGVHYASGIFLLDRDPDAALAEFRKELQIRPQHVLARLQLVAGEIKAGNADAAIATAQEAVRLEPKNPLCQIALGRALLSKDDAKAAIAPLEAAAKLGPENPQSHFYLEQAYRRSGRDADARKEKAEFTRLRAEQDPLNITPSGAAH